MVKSLHQRVVLSAKKKNSRKDRFLSTKHEVSDLDDVPEDDDDALLVFMLLMKREPRRAKKQPNRKEPFSPRSSVSSLSVPKEKRERETNEKEIQRYLKLRLVSRSLPFSSRCGCFSLVRKKRLKSFEKRVPWRRCGS